MNRKILSRVSSKPVDAISINASSAARHTQETSQLKGPHESELPQPPWFTTNTMGKNSTSGSQKGSKNALSNPKQRSMEQPNRKIVHSIKGGEKKKKGPQKCHQNPTTSLDGRLETETAAMAVELSEMGYDRRRAEKALQETQWDLAKGRALMERNKNVYSFCKNHSKGIFSKQFAEWCEKRKAQEMEGKIREMLCVDTKEFRAVQEYCSQSNENSGIDMDGEFWIERCCSTRLEYSMHLKLLEVLGGQLFLFHGTTWDRVESILENGFDRYIDRFNPPKDNCPMPIEYDSLTETGVMGICVSSFKVASFYVDARGNNTLTGKGGGGGVILLCSCAMGKNAANGDCGAYAIGWNGDKRTECCIYRDDEYILQRDFQVLPLYAIPMGYPVITCNGCWLLSKTTNPNSKNEFQSMFQGRKYPRQANNISKQYVEIYTCAQCPDFDYCQSCYRNGQNCHRTLENHTFVKCNSREEEDAPPTPSQTCSICSSQLTSVEGSTGEVTPPASPAHAVDSGETTSPSSPTPRSTPGSPRSEVVVMKALRRSRRLAISSPTHGQGLDSCTSGRGSSRQNRGGRGRRVV